MKIRLGDLIVNRRAQRAFRKERADELSLDFKLDLTELCVNIRVVGSVEIKSVMDGQHHLAPMLKMFGPDYEWECKVWTGLSEEGEAVKFLELNNQLRVTEADRFPIAVVGKEELETEISVILERNGIHAGTTSRANTVSCYGALRDVISGKTYHNSGLVDDSYDGASVLDETLKVLKASMPDFDAAFERTIILGIGAILAVYGSRVNRSRLIKQIPVPFGAHGFRQAVQGRRNTIKGVPQWWHVAQEALYRYNTNMTKNALPQWPLDKKEAFREWKKQIAS